MYTGRFKKNSERKKIDKFEKINTERHKKCLLTEFIQFCENNI